MTYNARKVLTGQEVVEAIKIYADGCRYATPAMLAARAMVTSGGSSLSAGATGDVLTLTVGDASLFGAEVWIRMPSGEVLKADVDTATQVTVTARGLFGTTPVADSGSMICRMMHEGEADGSCSGLAQSCSADTAYDGTTLRTLQFSYAPLPAGTVYSNGLRRGSVSRDGPEVHPGRDIGTRARLTFTLDDELDEADEFNPYRDRVATGGTKLGKLLARNPYFETRKCEFLEGLRDAGTYDEPDWVTRGYVIDKVEFSKGQARFTCLDPLILAEDRKSKTPPQSTGKLSAAITGTPATFSYTDADNYAYGANTTTTWVRIDSEIIKCTVTGATTLTVVTRGYKSETKDHEDGALIQLCDVFINEHMVDAIEWILTNRTTTPAAYIGSYAALVAAIPDKTITETILSKPLDSTQRVNELIRLADLTFYFDEIDQEIVIEHYPEMSIEPVSLNDDDHFGKESIDIQRNADQQFTRFTYAWAPYDLTKDSDEYFQFSHSSVNATLEGPRYLAAPNEKPSEKTLFLTSDPADAVLAASYVSRTMDRLAELPSILTTDLDAETVGDTQGGVVAPGKILSVSTASDQSKTGDRVGGLYQIERISGTLAKGYRLKARRFISIAPETVDYTIAAGTYTDYDLSDHYAPAAGAYIVYISPGAIFGPSSTAAPAFTTGTQAGGVSFHFIHRGQIYGAGGAGGEGGQFTGSGSSDGYYGQTGDVGLDGGPAFDATVDCTIDTGSGVIWAGGGGAGGQSSSAVYSSILLSFTGGQAGNGGDGGRGFITAAGGAAGLVNVTGVFQTGAAGADGGYHAATGGDWGRPGPSSTINWFYEPGRAAGGAAGIAVVTNGNTVTITAGNNPTNIKGAIV